MEEVTKTRGTTTVLRAAGAMGAATFLSRIMGLVREQVIAHLFGAGNFTDAYIVAFRIPNLLRDLFAEGAMSASLVPTFTAARAMEGERRAWRVAGLVFRVLSAIVAALALFGIFFAPQLVGLYASAFHNVPGKFELTVLMTRIMFPYFPLVALAAAYMGILNSCGIFFLPAFAAALFNVTSIIVGVAGAIILPRFGLQPIVGMAIGVIAGGAAQSFSQLPKLYRVGYRWQPKIESDPVWYQDPALRRMLYLMGPGMIGMAATQVNVLVNSILATSQGPGAVSWLGYAFRLMQFPIGLFGVSLAAATLPQISRLWVDRDLPAITRQLDQSLRTVLAINLPATVGLIMLGEPIIELLFQHGHFSVSDTRATAIALAAYASGLVAYSAVKVLVPACYALGNTRLPVLSSAVSVCSTIILNLIMVRPFGYWGLALGTSIAVLINAVFLMVAVRHLLHRAGQTWRMAPILFGLLQYGMLALGMGLALKLSMGPVSLFLSDAGLRSWLGMGGVLLARSVRVSAFVVEGMASVLIIGKLFKMKEIEVASDLFTKKIKKMLSLGSK